MAAAVATAEAAAIQDRGSYQSQDPNGDEFCCLLEKPANLNPPEVQARLELHKVMDCCGCSFQHYEDQYGKTYDEDEAAALLAAGAKFMGRKEI